MERYKTITKENIVDIYARLSDENKKNGQDISKSIQHQIDSLKKYSEEQGWRINNVLFDDGVTGTTFDRNGFKSILQDIKDKKINIVLTTDLSRLGREHIFTDYYLEYYFPLHNIRYVAKDDVYDSFTEEGQEVAPYKNLNNEYHARTTSKKVRSVWKTKSENGEHFGRAPYRIL